MQTEYGPYRIIKKIATGGMAEIYLATQRHQEGVGRKVVLKKILTQRARDEEFVTMFLDEARLMAALSHPNIAQVLDFGNIEGSYYLVMEYVHGPTLGALLEKTFRTTQSGLPEREAIGVAMAIAEALTYLHSLKDEHGRPLNVVHRDLNPSNVMVSYTGSVKLIDFGIAKSAARVYETRTGVIKGTYGYIAPEQFTSGALVDHRADVFALGVLLYEMCLGHHPFHGEDESLILERIFSASYKRPKNVVSNFPKTLDRIITECLTPHPEGRPRDVEQLIRRLAEHLLQRGLVPTMVDLGRHVSQMVPDTDGQIPIPSLRAPSYNSCLFSSFGPKTQSSDIPAYLAARSAHASDASVTRAHRTFSDSPTIAKEISQVAPDLARDPNFMAAESSKRSRFKIPFRDSVSGRPSLRKRRTSRMDKLQPKKLRWAWITLILVAAALGGMALRPKPSLQVPALPSELPTPDKAEARTLRIETTPSGASVFVNNQPIPGVTPIQVSIAANTPSVWIRVTLKGYLDDEREVLTSSGETKFLLRQRP